MKPLRCLLGLHDTRMRWACSHSSGGLAIHRDCLRCGGRWYDMAGVIEPPRWIRIDAAYEDKCKRKWAALKAEQDALVAEFERAARAK